MFIKQKYDYPLLESVTSDTGYRYYVEPVTNNKLASVTTILSEMTDKTALIAWRERLGNEEADRQSKYASGLGSIMHSYLEDHIAGKERKSSSNLIYKVARGMADTVISRGLAHVDDIWGYEVKLFYPGLYAGTADLISTYKGQPAIVDYKNTKKMKKREWIDNYFLQLSAYALAHNEMFGTEIKSGIILMVSRELDFKEFVIEGLEFQEYQDRWLRMVDDYYKKHQM